MQLKVTLNVIFMIKNTLNIPTGLPANLGFLELKTLSKSEFLVSLFKFY